MRNKDYEGMARRVLARRDAEMNEKAKRNAAVKRVCAVSCALALTVTAGIGLAGGAMHQKDTIPLDSGTDPFVSTEANNGTAPEADITETIENETASVDETEEELMFETTPHMTEALGTFDDKPETDDLIAETDVLIGEPNDPQVSQGLAEPIFAVWDNGVNRQLVACGETVSFSTSDTDPFTATEQIVWFSNVYGYPAYSMEGRSDCVAIWINGHYLVYHLIAETSLSAGYQELIQWFLKNVPDDFPDFAYPKGYEIGHAPETNNEQTEYPETTTAVSSGSMAEEPEAMEEIILAE